LHGRGRTIDLVTIPVKPPARTTDYIPLALILGCAALAATALRMPSPSEHAMLWMSEFMGIYLVFFAMLKLFDLNGFAECFRNYDLLARSLPGYAHFYPFLELTLGLAYLARFQLKAVSALMLALSLFGALGVFLALWSRVKVNYACMGTARKVPLSRLALVENLGMAAMAAAMLLM